MSKVEWIEYVMTSTPHSISSLIGGGAVILMIGVNLIVIGLQRFIVHVASCLR